MGCRPLKANRLRLSLGCIFSTSQSHVSTEGFIEPVMCLMKRDFFLVNQIIFDYSLTLGP